MGEIVQIGTPPIPVEIKRSARARRFSLRISNATGGISLTLPNRASKKEALAFAAQQYGWMQKHLTKRPDRIVPGFGGHILLDGVEVALAPGAGRSVRFAGNTLYIPGREDQLAGKLRAYLKTLARERLVAASETYARAVGRDFSRITLRDTRSRWGSCTTDGNLMYSWRLIMAPRAVQDYVAAHEVCHLVEMNHSPAYWSQVAAIYPDYKTQRAWLRQNGAQLHRYQL